MGTGTRRTRFLFLYACRCAEVPDFVKSVLKAHARVSFSRKMPTFASNNS